MGCWVQLRGDKAQQALFRRMTLNALEAIPLSRDGASQQATLTAPVDPSLTAKRGGETTFSSMERGRVSMAAMVRKSSP